MQPKADKKTELESTFNELVIAWHKEANYWSFSDQRASHWAYRRIIDLGRPALPLIFRKLEADGDIDWRHALEIITGEDPVTEEMWGERGAARKAWLNWAKQQGHQW